MEVNNGRGKEVKNKIVQIRNKTRDQNHEGGLGGGGVKEELGLTVVRTNLLVSVLGCIYRNS